MLDGRMRSGGGTGATDRVPHIQATLICCMSIFRKPVRWQYICAESGGRHAGWTSGLRNKFDIVVAVSNSLHVLSSALHHPRGTFLATSML